MDCQATNSFSELMFDIWKDVGKESTLQVSGWSMHPLIKDGDSVVVKHTRQDIKPGETVAFMQGQRIIVHRVLRRYRLRGETFYVNRGDRNQFIDSRVRENAILGKVVAIERKSNNRKIILDSPFWQSVGFMVVKCVNVSRYLPRYVRELDVTRKFGRAVFKILSIA